MSKVSLKDLEIRYKNLKESYPEIKQCSIIGCKNPRDITELLGKDTTCAYHRLLFDYWIMEIVNPDIFDKYFNNQKARRSAFTRWRNKMGDDSCNEIVLRLAQEPINWKC